MTTSRKLKLRPYARILTMLGDQLIKNERIALVEVIKNSYDADASWVKVTFEGFTEDLGMTPRSRIVIEDDGDGMNEETIEKHWVNPATPIKHRTKQDKPVTRKGRVIQGEKGIGRFALLKLGRRVHITTRTARSPGEIDVILDVSMYDAQFGASGDSPLFLDELDVAVRKIEPAETIRKETIRVGARQLKRSDHGTRIVVSHLEGNWSRARLKSVYQDLMRLQSPFDLLHGKGVEPDFEVAIHQDSGLFPFTEDYAEQLSALIENNAVLRIEKGRFDGDRTITFDLDGKHVELLLDDPDVTGLKLFRREHNGAALPERGMQCGPFQFAFYAFDFSADAKGRYKLDNKQREFIKNHRIYLYRDGVRVYPYGDPDDDWLRIDVDRGTIKASEFLSNDQVVGHVDITQADNPRLIDKTSREGLIDTGYPTQDFTFVIRLILAWIRKRPYTDYRNELQTRKEVDVFKQHKVQSALDDAFEAAAEDPTLSKKISAIRELYQTERNYLVHRAESTEHLAGVGLSVETASHDVMVAMTRAIALVDQLAKQTQRPGDLDKQAFERELMAIRGSLAFVETQLKDIQLLFRSSKQRRRSIVVREVLDKVLHLFRNALDRAQIAVDVEAVGSPLVAKTTDAVLLQVFLNLFDNALYWLQAVTRKRRIRILLNGNEGTLIFSDNGPGVRADDAAYVFEPFFSGKGEEGRGLGLYIARQLLERHDYAIGLADLKNQRLLPGATFVISFVAGGDHA